MFINAFFESHSVAFNKNHANDLQKEVQIYAFYATFRQITHIE